MLAADAIIYFAVGNKIKASLESPEPLLHVCVKNLARESNLPFQPEISELSFPALREKDVAKKLLFIKMNFCSWSINKQVKVSYLQQI